MDDRYFLTDSRQLADFDRDQERFARQIRIWQQKKAVPQPLVPTIVDLASAFMKEQNHGFQGIGIAVDGGDGMTWSAHSVDRGIQDAFPDAQRIRFQGQPGVYGPELAHVISMRRIATTAQRHGLIKSVRLIGWRLTTVAVLAALIVGAAGAVLSAITKTSGTSTSITLRLVVFSSITVALAMIGQFIGKLIYPDFRSNTLAKVTDDLKELEKGSITKQYQAFVDELAVLLGGLAQFRCVIVDDFGVLDRTTRMVLQRYLCYHADDQRSELWVIFYSAADKSLELEIERPMRNKPIGYRRIRLFQQEPLTESQRRQLAEEWGVPGRSIFRTVRAITQDPSGLVHIEELFGQAHQERRSPAGSKRAADALDLFYILAINANCGGNPWLYERDIVANFSRERGLRSQILQALLPGRTLSRALLTAELGKMKLKFFPQAGEVVDDGSRRRLRASAEAGEMLEGTEVTHGKWAVLDLADPRLVHLFWVLYWSDTELNGLPDAFFLQKIVTHLLRCVIPAELDDEMNGQKFPLNALAKELFEVAIGCLAACLRYCLLDDVPHLLERAKELVEDAGKEESRRRRCRLRRVAWQAYELTGDESVLSVALDLEPVVSVAAQQDDQSDLLELFLNSMPDATAERRHSIRRELERMDGGRSVTSYAQIRASWLAASIEPFLCAGTTALSAAVAQAYSALPEMLARAISAADSAVQDEWRTTDILDISLGIWVLTASTCQDKSLPGSDSDSDRHAALVDILNDCYILADDLANKRRQAEPDVASLDLVADCLAEDLLAVVFAAGLALLARWPIFNESRAPGWSDVANVVRNTGHSLGIRVPLKLADEGSTIARTVITDAASCMGVLAVLWRRMGFRQQASFMTIRRAQFITLALPPNPSIAEQVIQLLSEDFAAVNYIGLLTLLAAAQGARFSNQLASQILLRCSTTARDGSFGDKLVTEICYLTLRESHVFGVGLDDNLKFLTGHRPGDKEPAGTRLDAVLDDVEDTDLANVVLCLLNSMLKTHDDAIGESTHAALDRRIIKIKNAGVATTVNSHLRIYEVQRRQSAGEAIDVSAELDAWIDMRDQASYAFILSMLVVAKEAEQAWDRILGEALQVLQAPEKYLTNAGYVYLAHKLLLKMKSDGHPVTSEGTRTATAALRVGALTWQQSLWAEDNIRIFRLLTICDPKNAHEYEQYRNQWEQIVLELDMTQRLPRLVDQGRFFMLFWHYYTFFSYYGLQSEPPVNSGGMTEAELSQELAKWRKSRHDIPEAILAAPSSSPIQGTGTGVGKLSGEFLTRGYALFFPPAADAKQRHALDIELEDGRHQFDQEARGAIEALYRILRSLPRLPPQVEKILARHQNLVLARIAGLGGDSRSVA